jgi:hypothetical protein
MVAMVVVVVLIGGGSSDVYLFCVFTLLSHFLRLP